MTNRFILLDNSLTSSSGHSLNYALSIKRECERIGLPFRFIGTAMADSAVLAQAAGEPTLAYSLSHMFPAAPNQYGQLNFSVLNNQFFIDLCKGVGPTSSSDLLFIPTTNYTNLFGLYLWLTTLAPDQCPKVKVFLRWNTTGNMLMMLSLQLLRSIPSVSFVTDTEYLSRVHGAAGIAGVEVVPIPHSHIPGADMIRASPESLNALKQMLALRNSEGGTVFGFFGEARVDKGYHLVPEIVSQTLRQNDRAFFLIKTTTKVGGNSQGRQFIDEATVRLAAMPRNVCIVDEAVDEGTYAALMNLCDGLFFPYLPENYVGNSSGVFSEAVVLEKPVVVPNGTWMAEEAAKYGVGHVACAATPEAFSASINVLASDFDTFKIRSSAAAPAFKKYHSAKTLLEKLIQP
jgi:hypothetical protein